jgi:MSHA biogenesis protein MshO
MKRTQRWPTDAGFTLVEMVVAITLAAIVVGFVGTLLKAPIDQFAQQTQRATLADSATAAWPQMREDLRTALPNSARVRRNGSVVVIELLAAVDRARYQSSPNSSPFVISGTFALPLPLHRYLSVNNLGSGAPGADAYALSGSMTGAASTISVDAVGRPAGEQNVSISPAPMFASSSTQRIYLVSGPVTYLCDETAGTLSRYSNYSIAANQAARDTAGELLAAGNPATAVRQLAQGITSCDFIAGPGSTTAAQLVTVRITATSNNPNINNDSIQLVEQAALENLP